MEKAPLDPVTALARVRNGAAPPTWTLVIPTPPSPAAKEHPPSGTSRAPLAIATP